jgi:hypothetical protein
MILRVRLRQLDGAQETKTEEREKYSLKQLEIRRFGVATKSNDKYFFLFCFLFFLYLQ